MSLGNGTGTPLFGARIATYSPGSKSGTVWLDGESYIFDMNGCFRTTGGHTDVDLSTTRDQREPQPRRAGPPGESVVVYRRNGRIAKWGYRAAPDLRFLMSPQILDPHAGCTFTFEVRPRRSRELPPATAVGQVVSAVFRDGRLIVRYTPREGDQRAVLTKRIPIDKMSRFEDLRTGRWSGYGPVGRMIIELEGETELGIVVLYER